VQKGTFVPKGANAPDVPPLILPADISQPDQARAVVLSTVAHFGRLDVLVNNAGILRMSPFMDMPVNEMREIFETNFWATIETVRAAIPVMEKQGGGHIVQVGSGVSRRGLPFMAAYAASKFALLGLTEGLRMELAPKGITMSLVLPGGTETEMPANLDRSRLPPTYPSHERSRVSAHRAARAVVKAVENKQHRNLRPLVDPPRDMDQRSLPHSRRPPHPTDLQKNTPVVSSPQTDKLSRFPHSLTARPTRPTY
jgi:NAD(P)-dependent dehydrogenase (short-subunit alcohol dehydrogenase family)